VLQAFATVPRDVFLGPGPWTITEDGNKTGSDDAAMVYQDIGMGLAPGIPSGLPSLHALLLDAANVEPGSRVMHVGAGTGYFTAILAELVGPSGQVVAFEVDGDLAARAHSNLEPWPWASVEPRSGVCIPEQPVDLIYVNAGVQQLPRQWLDALAVGGRLVCPLSTRDQGGVFMVRRERHGHSAQFLCRARFVPCIGTQDDALAARLDAALRGDGCKRVRSLQLGSEPRTEATWFAGDGWRFSTEALDAARPA
jgi:protein-L-isoaspartate(D-aspartate) O-methyltransferase